MIELTEGDTNPSLVLLLRQKGDPTCPGDLDPRDLTDVTVRALFFKLTAEEEKCGVKREVSGTRAKFYRELTKIEVELLKATAVNDLPGDPAILSLTSQPQGPQKLSLEITGFVGGGSIQLTGKDGDGNAESETLSVTQNETLTTSKTFASIDSKGIQADGEYTVRVYVYDGRVQLDWQSGDLDEEGLYGLVLEEHTTGGKRHSSRDPIHIRVDRRFDLPVPTISSVSPTSASVGTTLTLTGKNFFEATKIELVNQADLSVVELDSLAVTSSTQATGDVPAGTAAATYWVQITTPGGTSTRFSSVTVS